MSDEYLEAYRRDAILYKGHYESAHARIRELEAACRKVLIVYGDETGDGAEGDAIAAVRAALDREGEQR